MVCERIMMVCDPPAGSIFGSHKLPGTHRKIIEGLLFAGNVTTKEIIRGMGGGSTQFRGGKLEEKIAGGLGEGSTLLG